MVDPTASACILSKRTLIFAAMEVVKESFARKTQPQQQTKNCFWIIVVCNQVYYIIRKSLKTAQTFVNGKFFSPIFEPRRRRSGFSWYYSVYNVHTTVVVVLSHGSIAQLSSNEKVTFVFAYITSKQWKYHLNPARFWHQAWKIFFESCTLRHHTYNKVTTNGSNNYVKFVANHDDCLVEKSAWRSSSSSGLSRRSSCSFQSILKLSKIELNAYSICVSQNHKKCSTYTNQPSGSLISSSCNHDLHCFLTLFSSFLWSSFRIMINFIYIQSLFGFYYSLSSQQEFRSELLHFAAKS